MHRSLLPFILASLGVTLFAWSMNMPLFEWQISEIVTNPLHRIQFGPSPWIAEFGDSLEDSSVIFHQFDDQYCGSSFDPEKLKSVVRRSWSEARLEQITRNINYKIIPWLWIFVFLCGLYIWWYALHYKRPITEVIMVTVVVIVLLCILLDVSRPFFAYVLGSGCFEGTITFNARLSKVHYETLLVLFTAIMAEIGAAGIMLRQISKAKLGAGL